MLAQLEVERAERLVEKHEGRFEDEAACDRHALALPARQGGDAPLRKAAEPDPPEHARCFLVSLGARDAAADEAIGDILADAHHREEGKALKDHVHRAAVGAHAEHRLSADAHVPVVGGAKARDHPHERGLAAA